MMIASFQSRQYPKEAVIALPMLLIGMIFIDFLGYIWKDIQILKYELVISLSIYMINLLVATTLVIEI